MQYTNTGDIEPEHGCGGHPDVMIVEDERVARRALAFLLQCSGYRPQVFESAEDALLYTTEPPKVALIDVDLPGMSGLDLAERLKQRWPGVVNVLITAADGERVSQFLKSHRAEYFPKPLDFSRLLDLLSQTQSN